MSILGDQLRIDAASADDLATTKDTYQQELATALLQIGEDQDTIAALEAQILDLEDRLALCEAENIVPPVVAGTWVLQQVSSATQVKSFEPQFNDILSHLGLTGLSVRVPWKNLEPTQDVYDFSMLDEAKRIADANNKPLYIRFMAGASTPSWNMGRTFTATGSFQGQNWTATLPCPFLTDGSPNEVFESSWRDLVDAQVVWCKNNGVKFFAPGWFGGRWAELYLDDMNTLPGYTYPTVRDAHFRLLDYAISKTGPEFWVQMTTGGYTGGTTIAKDINARIAATAPDTCFTEVNNITDTTTLAAYNPPPRRGWQMLLPVGYTDWQHIYDECFGGGEFLEVYTPSFSQGNYTSLYEQAGLHA